jgi:hypothetical protein
MWAASKNRDLILKRPKGSRVATTSQSMAGLLYQQSLSPGKDGEEVELAFWYW